MTNAYSRALAEQKALTSHKLKEVGDQWRTPDALFWGINAMFGPLVLDLFTDGENSKCPAFYTVEDNALAQDWSARLADLHGAAFGNPPYSRAAQHEGQYITGMTHIMGHLSEMREKGGRYVFLIKAATGETWWPEHADHIALIRGRIGFDLPTWYRPREGEPSASSAGFGAAIAVFDKSWSGPAFSYVQRHQLLAQGEAFLAQLRREAERLMQQNQPQNIPEIIPAQDKVETVKEPAKAIEKQMGETEIPLTQDLIRAQSGVHVWACAAAAFGDKAEFTFNESKYAHAWAADSVERPEFVVVPEETIVKALNLIRLSSDHEALRSWITTVFMDTDPQTEIFQRLSTVATEFNEETGRNTQEFISVLERIGKESCMNIRLLRSKVRDAQVDIPALERTNEVWPVEVNYLFGQVTDSSNLEPHLQNKLRHHINRLKMDGLSTAAIITTAGTLARKMGAKA